MTQMDPGPNVNAVAAESNFGRSIRAWDVWPRAEHLFSLIGTSLMLIFAVVFWLIAMNVMDGRGPAIILAILAGALALNGVRRLGLFVWAMMRSGRQVALFERGLIEARNDHAEKIVAFSGSDLTEERVRIIKNGKHSGNGVELKISCPDGTKVGTGRTRRVRLGRPSSGSGRPCRDPQKRTLAGARSGHGNRLQDPVADTQGVLSPTGEIAPYESASLSVAEGIWTLHWGNGQTASGSVNDTLNFKALRWILEQRHETARA